MLGLTQLRRRDPARPALRSFRDVRVAQYDATVGRIGGADTNLRPARRAAAAVSGPGSSARRWRNSPTRDSKRLTVVVEQENLVGRRFYEKKGFTEAERLIARHV